MKYLIALILFSNAALANQAFEKQKRIELLRQLKKYRCILKLREHLEENNVSYQEDETCSDLKNKVKNHKDGPGSGSGS